MRSQNFVLLKRKHNVQSLGLCTLSILQCKITWNVFYNKTFFSHIYGLIFLCWPFVIQILYTVFFSLVRIRFFGVFFSSPSTDKKVCNNNVETSIAMYKSLIMSYFLFIVPLFDGKVINEIDIYFIGSIKWRKKRGGHACWNH